MNKPTHLYFIFLFLFFLPASVPSFAAGSTSFILLKGQSKDVEMLFSIERATPVTEGVVTILKANDTTLTINADEPGATNIDVVGTEGERHKIAVIVQQNLQRIQAEFEALIPPSVIVSPLPLLGKLRAEGSFKDRKERKDFLNAMEMFNGMVVDQTRYSEMDDIKRSLEQRLPRGVEITYRPELDSIVLEGVITSPKEWEEFQRVLSLYGGKGVRSIVVHEPGPDIFFGLRDDLARVGVPLAAYPNIDSGLRVIYKREFNAIVVEGELTSEDHLESYQRIMSLYQGRGVKNMVTYEAGPEAIWSLKRSLEQEGFAVTTDGGTDTAIGVVRLHYTRGVLTISGSFPTQEQIKHIERIVRSQPLLSMAGGGGGRVRALMNLEFKEQAFEVNIAFHQVGATHSRTVGINLAERGWPSIDLLGLVTRKRGDTSTTRSAEYRVESIMGGQIDLSNGTSPGKLSSGTMVNVRTDGGRHTFHNGGSVIIPITGILGGTAGVSEIEFGLKGSVQAEMTREGEVALRINASLNAMPSSFGDAYAQDVLANFRNLRVTLPVGYSRIAGGHQVVEASRRKTGVPGVDFSGFRSSSELFEDTHIAMLVSVHPVGGTEPDESALSKLFRFVPERAQAPLGVIQDVFLQNEPSRSQKQVRPLHAIKSSEPQILHVPPQPPPPRAYRSSGKGGNKSRR